MGQRTSQLIDISVHPCAASEEFTGIAMVRGPCLGDYCTLALSVDDVVSTTCNIQYRKNETGDLSHKLDWNVRSYTVIRRITYCIHILQAKTTTMGLLDHASFTAYFEHLFFLFKKTDQHILRFDCIVALYRPVMVV